MSKPGITPLGGLVALVVIGAVVYVAKKIGDAADEASAAAASAKANIDAAERFAAGIQAKTEAVASVVNEAVAKINPLDEKLHGAAEAKAAMDQILSIKDRVIEEARAQAAEETKRKLDPAGYDVALQEFIVAQDGKVKAALEEAARVAVKVPDGPQQEAARKLREAAKVVTKVPNVVNDAISKGHGYAPKRTTS